MDEQHKLTEEQLSAMEFITLPNDNGSEIEFLGKLYAEHSFYDEDSGVLTQQRLYITADGHQAYGVISGSGRTKERRAYLIKRDNELCRINNGLFDVTVTADHLVTVVKGLCGLSSSTTNEEFFSKIEVEETEELSAEDKAANG